LTGERSTRCLELRIERDKRLEFVDPAYADKPRVAALRARPQRRYVAALPERPRLRVREMRATDGGVVGVLQRLHFDAVGGEFLLQQALLRGNAEWGRRGATGVPEKRHDDSWVASGRTARKLCAGNVEQTIIGKRLPQGQRTKSEIGPCMGVVCFCGNVVLPDCTSCRPMTHQRRQANNKMRNPWLGAGHALPILFLLAKRRAAARES